MGTMVKCPECGEILHSKHRHDFKQCKCPAGTFVDGGEDYGRIGGKRIDEIEILKHTHYPSTGPLGLGGC
jgi:hypothetical protein